MDLFQAVHIFFKKCFRKIKLQAFVFFRYTYTQKMSISPKKWQVQLYIFLELLKHSFSTKFALEHFLSKKSLETSSYISQINTN